MLFADSLIGAELDDVIFSKVVQLFYSVEYQYSRF